MWQQEEVTSTVAGGGQRALLFVSSSPSNPPPVLMDAKEGERGWDLISLKLERLIAPSTKALPY